MSRGAGAYSRSWRSDLMMKCRLQVVCCVVQFWWDQKIQKESNDFVIETLMKNAELYSFDYE